MQDLISSYGSSHSLNQSLNQSSISLGGSPAHAQSHSQSPSSSLNQSHPHSSLTNHISQLTSTPVSSLNHSAGGVSLSLTPTSTATTTTASGSVPLGAAGHGGGHGGALLSGARLPVTGLPPGHPMGTEANVIGGQQHLHPGHGVRSSPSSHLMSVNHSRSSPVPGTMAASLISIILEMMITVVIIMIIIIIILIMKIAYLAHLTLCCHCLLVQ